MWPIIVVASIVGGAASIATGVGYMFRDKTSTTNIIIQIPQWTAKGSIEIVKSIKVLVTDSTTAPPPPPNTKQDNLNYRKPLKGPE